MKAKSALLRPAEPTDQWLKGGNFLGNRIIAPLKAASLPTLSKSRWDPGSTSPVRKRKHFPPMPLSDPLALVPPTNGQSFRSCFRQTVSTFLDQFREAATSNRDLADLRPNLPMLAFLAAAPYQGLLHDRMSR